MKVNELAGCYMKYYEDTSVFITDIAEYEDTGAVAFNTSDGKFWFVDNNAYCEVGCSLCDGNIIFDENNGYLFCPEYWDEESESYMIGAPQEIDWIEEYE